MDLGWQGLLGTSESSSQPVHLQREPGPAAIPSCSLLTLSFSFPSPATNDSGWWGRKAITCKRLSLTRIATLGSYSHFHEEALAETKASPPFLPPGTAAKKLSQAGVGAARPPAHTVATAVVSPAAARPQVPTYCFVLSHLGFSWCSLGIAFSDTMKCSFSS